MRFLPFLTITFAIVLPLAGDGAATTHEEGIEFFEKEVRPLLAERCFKCHSAEKKVKGGLGLDFREGWVKGGDSGPAIVEGKPDESLLIEAVRYHDEDSAMPPKRKLPDAEIAVLEQWVAMGAPDPRTENTGSTPGRKSGLSLEEGRKFWSYRKRERPIVPVVADENWPRGDIDRFVLTKLEANGLRPTEDAAPEVLLRRLHFQLIGLPPRSSRSARPITRIKTNSNSDLM